MLYRLIVSTFRSLVACNALKETVVLFNIVVETMIYLFIFIFFVRILWWIENCEKIVMNWIKKQQHLFKTEIFCNIINVFSVTFKQFNASLLNKGFPLFSYWRQTF